MEPSPSPSAGGVALRPLSRSRYLLATVVYGLIRTVAATMRFHWQDRSGILDRNPAQPVIFCIWHNRLALCPSLYRQGIQRPSPGRHLAAMVSASRDGGLLARVLELFGVQPVRGSTSRRGPQALLELTSWAERGFDLAITPDGPRGPRYRVQEGVLALAQVTGLPIVPVAYHLAWKFCLKSWDRFQVPFPFGRCEVVLGPPLWVPRATADADREQLRRELEARLRGLTRD